MNMVHTRSAEGIFGPPIHAVLAGFSRVCLVAALVTDIVYSRTAEMMWTNFSAWLLAFGLLFGVLAAVFGMIAHWLDRTPRTGAVAWPHVVLSAVVLLLALFNNFVHSRDAWTSVVPTGLILSALTVLALLVNGWLGAAMAHRRPVEVRP